MRDDTIEKIAHAQPVLGGDQAGLIEAELEDLVGEMAIVRRIGLVGGDEHIAAGPTEKVPDIAVNHGQSFADIEEKHDDVRLFDRDFGLGLDRLARLALLGDLAAGPPQVQARGVDDRELASAPVGDAVKAVAPTEDAVKKRGLAHVWTAHDGDDRPGHAFN